MFQIANMMHLFSLCARKHTLVFIQILKYNSVVEELIVTDCIASLLCNYNFVYRYNVSELRECG